MHPGYIVTATKQQLEEIGIIHEATIEWLLSPESKLVKDRHTTPSGRVMAYLRHPNDTKNSHHMVWVYEDMLQAAR